MKELRTASQRLTNCYSHDGDVASGARAVCDERNTSIRSNPILKRTETRMWLLAGWASTAKRLAWPPRMGRRGCERLQSQQPGSKAVPGLERRMGKLQLLTKLSDSNGSVFGCIHGSGSHGLPATTDASGGSHLPVIGIPLLACFSTGTTITKSFNLFKF